MASKAVERDLARLSEQSRAALDNSDGVVDGLTERCGGLVIAQDVESGFRRFGEGVACEGGGLNLNLGMVKPMVLDLGIPRILGIDFDCGKIGKIKEQGRVVVFGGGKIMVQDSVLWVAWWKWRKRMWADGGNGVRVGLHGGREKFVIGCIVNDDGGGDALRMEREVKDGGWNMVVLLMVDEGYNPFVRPHE